MEENPEKHSDLWAFEKRYALWMQRYEQYLRIMDEYHQRMEGYRHQLALHKEERRHLQEIRDSLEREKLERAFRRANRPLPPPFQ